MNKKTDLQKLSNNLQSVFGSKNWHTLWQTHKLVESWPKLVGSSVATKSFPAYIKNNVLWIYVHDSLWMQHLQTQKAQLLDKINTFSDTWVIEDIRWLLQPDVKINNKKTRETNRVKKISPEEQKSFEKTASAVPNKECREALCRLWQTYYSNMDL